MPPARTCCLIACLGLLLTTLPRGLSAQVPARTADGPVVAVVGIPSEIATLERRLTGATTERIGGSVFTVGTLAGRRLVIGHSGIGKVSAAVVATILADRFKAQAIFLSGTAGALDPTLAPGDVIIATGVAQHDVGRRTPAGLVRRATKDAETGALHPFFFRAAADLLAAARRAVSRATLSPIPTPRGFRQPVVREGTIVTGDVFVADARLRDELQALGAAGVEMEGGAVAQVCWQFKTACLIVRSITDSADALAPERYEQFLAVASDNAASLVVETIAQLTLVP